MTSCFSFAIGLHGTCTPSPDPFCDADLAAGSIVETCSTDQHNHVLQSMTDSKCCAISINIAVDNSSILTKQLDDGYALKTTTNTDYHPTTCDLTLEQFVKFSKELQYVIEFNINAAMLKQLGSD